jgi:predicted dehydrogenase
MTGSRLGIGFIGSGFVAEVSSSKPGAGFAMRMCLACTVQTRRTLRLTAALARELRVGNARAFKSIEEMIAAPEIDCVWLCGPNHLRVQNMQAICDAIQSGKGKLIGIACEKPLARNVAEARSMVDLVEQSGLLHGYLEDQIFAPSVTRGKRSCGAERQRFNWSPLPCARSRRAQWPTFTMVLAGRVTGRWCTQRHDVSQHRSRPLSC